VYYATLRIGTPTPQSFTVIVDTGSATIAIPCKGCSACGSSHSQFDASLSSSASNTGGSYSQCYAEGSCNRGSVINDKMCLGESCALNEMISHDFGCCTTYARAFQQQQADGIIGFGGTSQTLITALREHHNLDSNEFAICLSEEGGKLTIGGYSRSILREPIQWTGGEDLNAYYHMTFRSVSVGEEDSHEVSIDRSALIDSGTSFTYVPSNVHENMKSAFHAVCSSSSNRCKGFANPSSALAMDRRDSIACYEPPAGINPTDANWLSTFPNIEFVVKNSGAKMCIPPDDYFFVSRGRAVCVGIFSDGQFIFGANLMQNFNFIFDADNSRIGFARAKCGTAEPACCGSCAENGNPAPDGPFEWCAYPWNPQACPISCSSADGGFNLTRSVKCLSSSDVEVDDAFCAANATYSEKFACPCTGGLDSGPVPPNKCDPNASYPVWDPTNFTSDFNDDDIHIYDDQSPGDGYDSAIFAFASIVLVFVLVGLFGTFVFAKRRRGRLGSRGGEWEKVADESAVESDGGL